VNHHFSPEQFSKWLLGNCRPDEMRHGHECAECSAELIRVKESLSLFRSSVRDWADRQAAPEVARVLEASSGFRPDLRRLALVSLAFTIGVVGISVPVYKYNSGRQREVQAAADAQLLDEVNMHLSRMVPAAMEPFLELLYEEQLSDETTKGEPR